MFEGLILCRRSGVFDWILGREGDGWTFGHRWARSAAGMGLRGLLWTLPAGYYLFDYGYAVETYSVPNWADTAGSLPSVAA